MPQQLSGDLQFFLSKSGEQFLCSCPALLPSYVARHPSSDGAKQLMLDVLAHLFEGKVFPVHQKADVDVYKFTV